MNAIANPNDLLNGCRTEGLVDSYLYDISKERMRKGEKDLGILKLYGYGWKWHPRYIYPLHFSSFFLPLLFRKLVGIKNMTAKHQHHLFQITPSSVKYGIPKCSAYYLFSTPIFVTRYPASSRKLGLGWGKYVSLFPEKLSRNQLVG